MRDRCNNPANDAYERYGGRGVFVCDEWNSSFEIFLRDIGPAPGRDYSIHRIDNDGGYEPSNVVWAYEALTGNLVRRTGFLVHPDLMAGCSVDGDVDDFTGIVELKCPKSATHLGYLRTQALPPAHQPQVLHNLWITGAQWCDFVSFDDRFPPPLQLFCVRVPRVEFDVMAYEKTVRTFLAEVDREVASVTTIEVTHV